MAFLLLHNYTDFIKMTRSIPQSGDRIDDNLAKIGRASCRERV